MNEQQREAIQAIRDGLNILVTGGAGTGKTFFIHCLREEFPHATIGVTSTTGSSALLINGTTVHAYLGLGILKNEKDIFKRIIKFKKTHIWEETDILVIDEVSMLPKELFEAIDSIAKRIRRSSQPFGGMQVVLCGDFCQLGVVRSEDFCFDSEVWGSNIQKIINLTEVYRHKDDNIFSTMLSNIRFGKIDDWTREELRGRMTTPPFNSKIIPTKLYPFRKDVREINEKFLQELIKNYPLYKYEIKTKSGLVKKTIPMEPLQICQDAQVILTRNLDIENGLVNGSRGVVTHFIDGKPMVQFRNGHIRLIEYFKYEIEEDDTVHVYEQMPLILGWAITIHKSQGMTLDYVETDLTHIFEYGQGYVTLSRVRKMQDLFLKGIDFKKIRCNPKVIQFYNEI